MRLSSRSFTEPWPFLMRVLTAMLFVSFLFALSSALPLFAQSDDPDSAADFLRKLEGEWVGMCEQSTDGEKAEDKFFYVIIKELDENTFESQFDYYRLDTKTELPVPAGSSTIITTIETDGSATSVICGTGTVMVYEKLKSQEHELTEVITAAADGLQSEGAGTIKVGGMPFGLGKNGKVISAKSLWTIEDGNLVVKQTLKVGFRALFIHKTFDIVANYTAKRGSDIAAVIQEKSRVSSALRPASS